VTTLRVAVEFGAVLLCQAKKLSAIVLVPLLAYIQLMIELSTPLTKRDVRARADANVAIVPAQVVGVRSVVGTPVRRAVRVLPRIDYEQGGVAASPVEVVPGDVQVRDRRRVVLGGIRADDEERHRVVEVGPVVGHRSSSKRAAKTGHRGRVSYAGLVLDQAGTEVSDDLPVQVVLLVVQVRRAEELHRLGVRCADTPGVSVKPFASRAGDELLRDLGHRSVEADRRPRVVARPVPGLSCEVEPVDWPPCARTRRAAAGLVTSW